jgi:hypothetical protein
MSATDHEVLVLGQQGQHEAATTAEAAEISCQQETQQPEGCCCQEDRLKAVETSLESEALEAQQQQQHESQPCTTSSSGRSGDDANEALK